MHQIYTVKILQDLENGTIKIDPSLEDIVNRMMDRCMDYGQYRQALGVAIETKRLYVFNAMTQPQPRSLPQQQSGLPFLSQR